MGVLRTPDERFAELPGYPFPPRYVQVETKRIAPLRMHYVDAGPADGPVVLLTHGQPTWSYLYRKVIGLLAEAGLRVIAPDNIGSRATSTGCTASSPRWTCTTSRWSPRTGAARWA
jgi:haloalkane dehalogenase